MVELKLNGRSEKLANCYDDLTIGQFQSIFYWDMQPTVEERDYYALFHLLHPGYSVAPTPEHDVAVYELTRFVIEEPVPYNKQWGFKAYTLRGVTFEVPEEIGSLSIGQNIVLGQLLDRSRVLEGCMSMALAVYLQPLIDKAAFNNKRAEELEIEIRNLPAREVYGLAFFILNRVNENGKQRSNLLLPTTNNRSQRLKRMSQSWQEFPALLGILIFPLLLTMLPGLGLILIQSLLTQISTRLSIYFHTLKMVTSTKNDFHTYGT